METESGGEEKERERKQKKVSWHAALTGLQQCSLCHLSLCQLGPRILRAQGCGFCERRACAHWPGRSAIVLLFNYINSLPFVKTTYHIQDRVICCRTRQYELHPAVRPPPPTFSCAKSSRHTKKGGARVLSNFSIEH